MTNRYYIFLLRLFFGTLILGSCLRAAAQQPVQSMLRENGLMDRKEKLDSTKRFVQPASYFLSPKARYERVHALYLRQTGQQWLLNSRSSVTQLIADSLQDAGMLRVAYGSEKGVLHRPQEAYSHKDLSLSTWGFRQIGRVKVQGRFAYTRIWEDSLANNLSSHADGLTPYYYFSPKAGTFERQRFEMGLSLGYDIIQDRLYLGMGIDYLHINATGSVDPRPDDTWMQVDFRPGLTYRHGRSLVGLNLIKGYGRQDMHIKYKNKMYDYGDGFPERNYYLNMGYGSIVLKTQLVKDILEDHQGLAMDFSQAWQKQVLRGGLSYQKNYSDNRIAPDTSLASDLLARWSVAQYKGWLQFKSSQGNNQSLWGLNWLREKGHDSNIIFGGRNYFALNNTLGLSFLQSRGCSAGAFSWEWGANATYQAMERNDILAAHTLRSKTVRLGLNGALLLPSGGSDIWALQWQPALVYPLQVEASVPATQQNAFTNTIFYPMIGYQSMSRLENTLTLRYVSPALIKGVYSGFELGADYLKHLSQRSFDGWQLPATQTAADLTDGSYLLRASRWQLHLAFNLYL